MATATWFGKSLQGQYGTTAANRIDWVTDSIKCLLSTATPDLTAEAQRDAYDFRDDIAAECTGTNYSAGGVATAGRSISFDSATDEVRLVCSNVTFTNITVSGIRHAVFYKATGGASSTDPLMFCYRFDGDQTVAAADFTITIDATGAAKLDYT